MRAIRTGMPRPTLTPKMTLFETPLVLPSRKPRRSLPASPMALVAWGMNPVLVLDGAKEVGTPVDEIRLRTWSPKFCVLDTELNVVAGKLGVTPDGTAVTSVRTVGKVVVFWSETGQLMRPETEQTWPTNTSVVVMVVVVRLGVDAAACLAFLVTLGAAEVVDAVVLVAQASASVVKKMTVVVFGVGPHDLSATCTVAPAAAPTANS